MEEKLEVELISREVVKPSSPTPSHLKTFTLSLMDQTYEHMQHMPLILAYTNVMSKSLQPLDIDIAALKTSLSQTLTRFYPLAGRYKDESTVDCNDEGVPFIVTRVLSHPSVLDVNVSPNKPEFLAKFLPPQDLRAQFGCRPVSEQPFIAFQINVFPNGGGLVLGCYLFHKLLDATSFSTFLNYWGALASKHNEDVIHPDFNAPIKAFPPCPSGLPCSSAPRVIQLSEMTSTREDLVIRTFTFPRGAIRELKARATSDAHPNPTSFEAVAGFIWMHATLAAGKLVGPKTALSMVTSIRGKTNDPHLPIESIGNLFVHVKAQAAKHANLVELVSQMHDALSDKVVKEKIQAIKEDENRAAFMIEFRRDLLRDTFAGKAGAYVISSLCRIGLDKVDFGFGKPKWIMNYMIPSPMRRNFIFLTDYVDSSGEYGVLATFVLDEKEMQILESNSDFIDFTTKPMIQKGNHYSRL